MFYATLSLELYRRDPAGLDPGAVEREAQERLTPYRHVDGTYLHLGFGHLDGYSAIYYTYMWSLVIAKDLFTVFERDGLLSTETAARYREHGARAGRVRARPPTWWRASSAARTTSTPTRPGSTPDRRADHDLQVMIGAGVTRDDLPGALPAVAGQPARRADRQVALRSGRVARRAAVAGPPPRPGPAANPGSVSCTSRPDRPRPTTGPCPGTGKATCSSAPATPRRS